MREYDCIIVGQDLYALTVALFLSRKMRKVLVVEDSTNLQLEDEKINLKVGEKLYKFSYNRDNVVTGLDESGLLYAYMDSLGLLKNLEHSKLPYQMIVNQNGDVLKQINSFEDYRIYLTRHYPRSKKEIERFFKDLARHYVNYQEQYRNMLKNKDYTLTSLMIEWGDFSLKELLFKYFTDDDLIKEFSINNFINGLDIEEVNAYSFFTNFIVGLKSGFYILKSTHKELCDSCQEKIRLINPKAFLKKQIKEYVVNDKSRIECIIDTDNNLHYGKYYFVSTADPANFYDSFFKTSDKDLNIIESYYPNLEGKKKVSTLYLVLSIKLDDIGITESLYYFNNDLDDEIQLIRMYNYSKAINQDLRKKEGLLCIDFTSDKEYEVKKDLVIRKLDQYFPKIKKFITISKIGRSSQYLTMLRDESLRKNKSINELINVEAFDHILVIENLFVGGAFIRPEAAFYGVVNQGIVFGDKIEDKLYFGEDIEEQEYLSNDEIMMMIRHNYQLNIFDNKELHINFLIGKSSYFIRIKGKNIVVHHGKYNNADLSIYTTNDKLSELLLKKTSFKKILDAGFLKYNGDIDLLFKTVKAFQLDDYQQFAPEDYLTSKYKFLGVKLLFIHLGIYALSAFLSNYFNNIYIFPLAFVLTLIVTYIKFKIFESISWFEIVLNLGLLVFSVLSVFVSWFNTMLSDNIFLGFIVLVLLLSVFINQPVVFLYHQFDMKIDYRNTKLFKIIASGLSFIWGFLFLIILLGTYLIGNDYLSMFYSFLFFGILLTYYYPMIYVRTSIKK